MSFKVQFTRYCSKKGELRISAPQFIQADTFKQAHRRAEDILTGLKAADPAREFHIESIETRGISGRAVRCDGAEMFETQEELTERVREQAA